MVFVRKVKTASGATAVQLAEYAGGRDRVIEHLGSAHTEAELAVLLDLAHAKLHEGQDELDLDWARPVSGAPVVQAQASQLLIHAIRSAWNRLGFNEIGDEAFFSLVLARLVEPTSKVDSLRVLTELGYEAPHRNTFTATMKRCATRGYRDVIATKCFAHAATAGDVTLCLYDVTTLYFEAEHEDDLRKVGYSKERRVDPQVVVGLLVDRHGFPLEIGCFEGNRAETATIVRQFADRHNLADIAIVADAGMLSATNLHALDEAGLRFIVGSRLTKAPQDLESHFRWHGDAFTDGQIIDTITPRTATHAARAVNDVKLKSEPVWNPAVHTTAWRAVWAYSAKRAARDARTLTLQENRAMAVVEGERAPHKTRFVKTDNGARSLDEASLARARRLVGLKGYVTNIPVDLATASEVIGNYHDLWRVEQSFRMSKTDLRARPMFHHTRDAIEAHLTIVFAALAVARYLQNETGLSIKRIVTTLRPLREVQVSIAGHLITAQPQLTPEAEQILRLLGTH
ncbi:DDE family transposase [Yimella lutea]|uniref:DDE family transposase n=2 Tax=Yimella lutea TaxID=587872 RepID=A0A542EK45_9MICO|nr:IS1634 family transposase [Yimella lutea]TQJ15717.1 DDE family transposase [Yimella lutea]